MKPKAQNEHDDGLLEYLEDIIGTAKYKQPIEDAAKEVESMNEVCLEKSNRVAIVEKEKNNLEVSQLTSGTKDRVKKQLHWRISRMRMS
jgi:structural maintenance of chromosome 4